MNICFPTLQICVFINSMTRLPNAVCFNRTKNSKYAAIIPRNAFIFRGWVSVFAGLFCLWIHSYLPHVERSCSAAVTHKLFIPCPASSTMRFQKNCYRNEKILKWMRFQGECSFHYSDGTNSWCFLFFFLLENDSQETHKPINIEVINSTPAGWKYWWK